MARAPEIMTPDLAKPSRQEPTTLVVSSLSRRGFLQSSAAASAGLVIAMYLPGCGKPGEVTGTSGPAKQVVANAWLRIGTDGTITVLCDRSEMGQGVHTALPTLIAEELGVAPESIQVAVAPVEAVYMNSLLGTQATGGSTSVRDAWEKLRMAGAEARARLVAVAAKEWGAPPASCSVADGYVTFTTRRKSFGELAQAAAALPKPENVRLLDKGAFKYIGKPQRRLDTAAKVDGSARFGIDMRLPGMLYASLAQSPELGGQVDSVDDAKAKDMPGVRHVVRTASGVAVIADSWWQAKQARDALKIKWQSGPNARLDNAAINAGLKKAAASGKGRVARSDGDADGGLKAASKRIEAVYELPMLAHATMEPQNCTVEFKDGACHVHAPTQAQQMAQAAAMAAAGLPAEQVFVHTTFLGGGYGRRLDVDFIPAAVECAKAAGAPVKLLWTREDDTSHDKYRPPARNTCRAGLDAEGRLTAFKLQLVAPSITARWAPAVVKDSVDPFAIEAAHNFPYAQNVHIDYVQHEIGIDVGYWRSVSHALNCFTVESFMDEVAFEAGKDPYQFRREHLKQARWLAVLDAVAQKARWGNAPEGRHQGIALMSGYDTYLAQVAEISVAGAQLKIHRIVCVIDCGQMVNPDIVRAQAEGGIVFGLTAALHGDIAITGGKVRQQNFNDYRLLRINEVPQIEVYLLDSDEKPGGMGEPTVALVAPAVCNAIYAATRKRVRALPIAKQGFNI